MAASEIETCQNCLEQFLADLLKPLGRSENRRKSRRTPGTGPARLTDARRAIRVIGSVSRNGNEWNIASIG